MTIKLTHLIMMPLSAAVAEAITTTLVEAVDGGLAEDELCRRLGWSADKVNRLLVGKTAADLDGPPVLSLAWTDFAGLSPLKTRHSVEEFCVAPFGDVKVNALARMFGCLECDIRRIRQRIKEGKGSKLLKRPYVQ